MKNPLAILQAITARSQHRHHNLNQEAGLTVYEVLIALVIPGYPFCIGCP